MPSFQLLVDLLVDVSGKDVLSFPRVGAELTLAAGEVEVDARTTV
jgi:hypothetical protein